ncbi:MAG: nucleoside hydrolase [Bacteroidota bacterium]
MKKRLLIDTDTASDDAVALVMAAKNPLYHIEAVTVVAGNVPVDQGVQNACYTLELCNSDTPVYKGAAKPLLRPLETATVVHGNDGMGDIGLSLNGFNPQPKHAIDAIVDIVNAFPGEVTIVTLGPLTNLAQAILKDPSIAQKAAGVVVMGGTGQGPGNITPVAEFNIWVDPEAARIVFESGARLTMVGWDISRTYAVFEPADVAEVKGIDTALAHFCMDIQHTLQDFSVKELGLPGFSLPDPIAMAVALNRDLIIAAPRLPVAIETQSRLCRGQTVVDHVGATTDPANTEVVLEVSRAGFLEMLHAAVR